MITIGVDYDTTVPVKGSTRALLNELKYIDVTGKKTETYNEVIIRLIKVYKNNNLKLIELITGLN